MRDLYKFSVRTPLYPIISRPYSTRYVTDLEGCLAAISSKLLVMSGNID